MTLYRARDIRGRWITLDRRPQRIVSLVPSLSELICWLGASRRLVGVTRYCTHPPDIMRALRRVGGTKNPDCAAIRALQPDLVLANAEENRVEDVRDLEAAGLSVYVTFPKTIRHTEAMTLQIARLVGTPVKGSALAQRIAAARQAGRSRRVRVFCPIWRNPWMAFNADTYAHDMLREAGGLNVCAAVSDRYPQVDLSEIARCAPEVILLPTEPYKFSQRHIRDLEPLRDTPAYRNGRIHVVDGQALSWYGPRTPAALRYFRRLLRTTL